MRNKTVFEKEFKILNQKSTFLPFFEIVINNKLLARPAVHISKSAADTVIYDSTIY